MPDIETLDLHKDAHCAALLFLIDHYARDPMGGGKPLAPEACATLVERLRERNDYFGFIAWHEGSAVGLINCFEGFSTFAARPLLNVHDIVVIAACRGRGIGTALLGAAEELARSRGCCKLTLEVLSGNTGAMATYRNFGFAPYALDPAAGEAVFLQKTIRTT